MALGSDSIGSSSPPARRAIGIRAIGRERIRRITISAPFKDDGQKIQTDALSSGIVCFVSVALGLLVLWVAGDIVTGK